MPTESAFLRSHDSKATLTFLPFSHNVASNVPNDREKEKREKKSRADAYWCPDSLILFLVCLRYDSVDAARSRFAISPVVSPTKSTKFRRCYFF